MENLKNLKILSDRHDFMFDETFAGQNDEFFFVIRHITGTVFFFKKQGINIKRFRQYRVGRGKMEIKTRSSPPKKTPSKTKPKNINIKTYKCFSLFKGI